MARARLSGLQTKGIASILGRLTRDAHSANGGEWEGLKMRILGIDPGNSGAFVILEDGQPIEWMTAPTFTVGKKSRINAAAVAAWIRDMAPSIAYVEAVGAMPGQGVSSMFSFGRAAGVVDGVLAALDVPVTYVTPQQWKKRAGLIGTDKDAARARAIQLWPGWRALDKKGQGQALADAALIALGGGA